MSPPIPRNPPAGALQIVKECPPAWTLPHADEQLDVASQGIALHEYLRAVASFGPGAALARVPEEHREAAELLDLDELPTDPDAYVYELAWSLNVDTGEVVEVSRGDSAPMPNRGPRWINGRTDVLSLFERGCVTWVRTLDLKTGGATQTPARRSLQVLAEAVAGARLFGAEGARAGVLHAPPGRRATYDEVLLDGFALDAGLEELRGIIDRVQAAREMAAKGRDLKFRAGRHCTYCPALPYCPAHKSLVRSVLARPDAEVEIARLTPAEVAEAYDQVKALRSYVERVERSIYTLASARPVELSGGRVLGPVTTRRTTVGGEEAFDALTGLLGPSYAADATRPTTSKKAITSAVRAYVEANGGKRAEVERDVYRRIGELGGLTTRESTTVKEHDAGDSGEEDEG